MEAAETHERETIFGKSLRLDIPILTCSEVDCTKKNIFTPPPNHEVDANKYILYIINCFVDFFIQYQSIDDDDEPIEIDITKLLELKKIIFSFCLVDGDVDVETKYFEKFFATFQEKYSACIVSIKNRFRIVQNVGFPELSSMETFENKPTSFLWFKKKAINLFLVGLSYKVLSMSGSLGIQIKDISDIIRNEKQREKDGKQSFILQFLPGGKELRCFEKVELFFLEQMNSIIFQRISSLLGGGSSKRVLKKYNKSRKIKYKMNAYKSKSQAYKSRKSKRYRRKRT